MPVWLWILATTVVDGIFWSIMLARQRAAARREAQRVRELFLGTIERQRRVGVVLRPIAELDAPHLHLLEVCFDAEAQRLASVRDSHPEGSLRREFEAGSCAAFQTVSDVVSELRKSAEAGLDDRSTAAIVDAIKEVKFAFSVIDHMRPSAPDCPDKPDPR